MEKKDKTEWVWCPKRLKFVEKTYEQTLKDLQNLFGMKDGD